MKKLISHKAQIYHSWVNRLHWRPSIHLDFGKKPCRLQGKWRIWWQTWPQTAEFAALKPVLMATNKEIHSEGRIHIYAHVTLPNISQFDSKDGKIKVCMLGGRPLKVWPASHPQIYSYAITIRQFCWRHPPPPPPMGLDNLRWATMQV